MGYLRMSLTRAQRTRSASLPPPRHARQQSNGTYELTETLTTPSGIAVPDASVSKAGQLRPPVTHVEPAISQSIGRVETSERHVSGPALASVPPSSAPLPATLRTASAIQDAARQVMMPGTLEPSPVAGSRVHVKARRDEIRTQRKAAIPNLPDRPRTSIPEVTSRNSTMVESGIGGAANENPSEGPADAVSSQNSPLQCATRIEVKAPGFRVNWVEGNRSLSPLAREKVERQLVVAARSEFRQRAEAANAEEATAEIRVEHLTVKIENPQSAPASSAPPVARRTEPAGNASTFSDYFLRRCISSV